MKKILVSLRDQKLTAFEKDEQVFNFSCVTGDSKHLTPSGKYKILRKERKYRSKQYDAQMNFAMFITGDGVAIHECYYFENNPDYDGLLTIPGCFVSDSLAFGVSKIRNVYPETASHSINFGDVNLWGSHGCVRLSHDNAAKLFDWTELNTLVEIK